MVRWHVKIVLRIEGFWCRLAIKHTLQASLDSLCLKDFRLASVLLDLLVILW